MVGLMGSGKTTIGRLVAGALGVEFCDNDRALMDRVGMTAAELADREGTAALHDAELDTLLQLLEAAAPSVIAAAASTVESPLGLRALEQHAFVAWLHAGEETLAARARRSTHRPLDRDVPAQLAEHAATRTPLYGSIADVAVDVGVHDAYTSAQHVIDALRAAAP
jgi:shikimate kinase